MKIKFLSFFLSIIILLPTIMEVSAHLSDHNHEMCSEDGIHFHENEFTSLFVKGQNTKS